MWRSNPLERLNVAPRVALGSAVIKCRTNVVGIFPNDAAIVRLVGSQLLEQQEEWQLELTDADPSAQPDEPIN